jgi:KaiC/GvpD/RAD55 family RecA-like ATPase
LERALSESSAVAVFVGSQIGNWQWPEIGFALDRQANDKQFPVIPVLLDGADPGRSFLFLNTWVDLRGDRMHDAEALQRLLDAVSHPVLTDDAHRPDLNPYRGLEIFDEAHAPFFFGREKFIDDLFARLTERRKKFVAVIGASGSGKSSVVRAGLIPRLRLRRPPHETWDIAVFTPGERPWFRLADALGPLRFPDKSDADLDIEIDKLAAALQSGELQLDSLLDRILKSQGKLHRLLIVVDQFEELFTLTPSAERHTFIDRLLASLSVEGVVLLPTLRADFYGQAIEADRRLSDLLGQEQITLGRLTPEELTRAIVEPARLAHLEFDPGLPDVLLQDAGNEPGSLPLLQHALLELYTRGAGVRLTMDNYQAIGGIRKAIANSAEREYRRFEELGQGALVRAVFTQLVRLARSDEGLEDTRRRVTISALPSEAEPIVDEFASYRYRLLVKANERVSAAPGNGGHERPLAHETETVEVAHEALIREWDRLKNWLNEDRGFYLWRQRLDLAIKDYDEHGGEAEYLLQGPALKEAEGKLDAATPEPLAPRQCEFIERSMDQRDRAERQRREERERQLEEIAEQQQARSRLQRKAMWGLGIGGCVLVAIAVGVVVQTRAVARQTSLVLTDAGERADDDKLFDRGLRFGVLAAKESSLSPAHPNAAPQLARAAQASALRFELGCRLGAVKSAGVSADGERVVTVSGQTARVWDAESGKPVGEVLKHEDPVDSAAFSPDGERVVTVSGEGTARVWDAESGKPVGEVLKHEASVSSAAFSPDGKRVVTVSGDRTARMWDVAWSALARSPELVREVCEKKLVGSARRLTQADVAFSPILARRVGEDVCTGERTAGE